MDSRTKVPTCNHAPVVRVSSSVNLDDGPNEAQASTYCCERPECLVEARIWVESVARRSFVVRLDQGPARLDGDSMDRENHGQPHPQDLIQDLHVALYGTEHPASPDTPADVWDALLDVVARGRCACPPRLPPDRYDCDVCHGVQQRKQRRFGWH